MRILLLAYELDSNSMMSLFLELKKKGYEVFIFNCDQFSIIQMNESLYSYYEKHGLARSEYFNIKDEVEALNRLDENAPVAVNFTYLANLEKKFVDRTINQTIFTDQAINLSNHSRDHSYHPKNKDIVLKFAELIAKKIEYVFDTVKPDFIFTFDTQYFVKNLAYEIAKSREIKTLALIRGRIDQYYYLVDNFALGTSQIILKEMNKLISEDAACTEALEHIEKYKNTLTSSYTFHSQIMMTGANNKLDWKNQVLQSINFLPRLARASIRFRRYRGYFKDNYFNPPNIFKVTLLSIRNALRVRKYFSDPKLNIIPDLNQKFIYVPLHIIPESNVFLSKFILDERELVIQLSKLVPVDYKIYVKTNPEMLFKGTDTAPHSWYEKVKNIHNVRFISPTFPGKKLLTECQAVVCLTGTSLLEAAMLNKPAFRVGEPEFSVLDSVYEYDQKTFMSKLNSHQLKDSNLKYYLQAIINSSVKLEFEKYIYYAHSDFPKGHENHEGYANYMNRITDLFVNAIEERK